MFEHQDHPCGEFKKFKKAHTYIRQFKIDTLVMDGAEKQARLRKAPRAVCLNSGGTLIDLGDTVRRVGGTLKHQGVAAAGMDSLEWMSLECPRDCVGHVCRYRPATSACCLVRKQY